MTKNLPKQGRLCTQEEPTQTYILEFLALIIGSTNIKGNQLKLKNIFP